MGDYGIKISPRGSNVQTVTDKDTNFTSKFNTLKILAYGDISLTTDGSGNGSAAVSHGLGFAPGFYVFRKGTANNSLLDASSYANAFFPDPEMDNLWLSETFTIYSTSASLIISASGLSHSTTYNFRYYILIDLAETFVGDAVIDLSRNLGMRVSKAGVDVLTGQLYDMVYSQSFKSLQYYTESYKVQALTLNELNSTIIDTPAKEGTYVDIMHGLGYPPFFLAFVEDSTINYLTPYNRYVGNVSMSGYTEERYNSFCDADRIRLTFYREIRSNSTYPNGFHDLSQKTITFKCFVLTEDLTLSI